MQRPRPRRRAFTKGTAALTGSSGAREAEGLAVAVVMVGATHVGGVVVDPRWLEGRVLPRRGRLEVANLPCASGDDLGAFELGSTVILLVGGEKADTWDLTRGLGPVKVGERLGGFPG